MVVLTATALGAVLGAGILALILLHRAQRVLGLTVHRDLVVTLKSGEAFKGVLAEHDRHALVLTNVRALRPDGTSVPVDGSVIVLRPDVAYLQRP